MNNKEMDTQKKQKEKETDLSEETKKQVSDTEPKHIKDCRDNCMHCGYHCKYLDDN